MSQRELFARPADQAEAFDLDHLVRDVQRSRAANLALVFGLPALGVVATLVAGLAPFAALMAAGFLCAARLVLRTALLTFTGQALRLLVAARFVLVVVAGALLFCASGSAWAGVVSALVLWLTAGRLLGRRALRDLWKLAQGR